MLTLRRLFVPLCLSLSLSHPLQYTTDDLDYSQFYDYSEGATDIIPTDEYSEPQVNEKRKKEIVSVCVVRVSQRYVYMHTSTLGELSFLIIFWLESATRVDFPHFVKRSSN